MATITMSACLTTLGRSFVLEWQMVTVAFLREHSIATGIPTMLLLPITTTFFPSKLIPLI